MARPRRRLSVSSSHKKPRPSNSSSPAAAVRAPSPLKARKIIYKDDLAEESLNGDSKAADDDDDEFTEVDANRAAKYDDALELQDDGNVHDEVDVLDRKSTDDDDDASPPKSGTKRKRNDAYENKIEVLESDSGERLVITPVINGKGDSRDPYVMVNGVKMSRSALGRHKRTGFELTNVDPINTIISPSFERKTKNGGYAHTIISRARISMANTGNTPWNKGKIRSSSDRAKIAAGVRARNRAILLAKLERLGISEEQWFEKKKQIKYLRERIRRAKRSNETHAKQKFEKDLSKLLGETDVTLVGSPVAEKDLKNSLRTAESSEEEKNKGGESPRKRQAKAKSAKHQSKTDEKVGASKKKTVKANVAKDLSSADATDAGPKVVPVKEKRTKDQPNANLRPKKRPGKAKISLEKAKNLPSKTKKMPSKPKLKDPPKPNTTNMDADAGSKTIDGGKGSDGKPNAITGSRKVGPIKENDNVADDGGKTEADMLARAGAPPAPQMPTGVFEREIHWTPHILANTDYSKQCPVGGPGGLMCCEECTSLFMEYLTRMSLDIERFKLNKAGQDVQEIQEYLDDAQTALAKAIKAVDGKIPPPPPMSYRPEIFMSAKAARQQQVNDQVDDALTQDILSPMDLGDLSKFAYL